MNLLRSSALLLVLCAAIYPSDASAQHLDIMLYRSEEGLVAGGYDFGATPSVLPEYRVFAELLQYLPAVRPNVAFTGAPGWNALSLPDELPEGGSLLPGSSSVYASGSLLPSPLPPLNLAYWSGVGEPVFGMVPAGEVLLHARNNDFVVYDGGSMATPRLRVGSTNPSGGVHTHPSYALYGDATLTNPIDAPSSGVYLFALQAEMEGVGVAAPVYVLFGLQVDASVLSAASALVRSVVAPALPGDYNGDGAVSAADYTSWRDTLGSTSDLRSDGDGSGVVDAADYEVWSAHYATGAADSTIIDVAAVPEPAPLVAVLIAAASASSCPRRLR